MKSSSSSIKESKSKKSHVQDLSKRPYDDIFQSIEKNLIISNHNLNILDVHPKSVLNWLCRLEYLFGILENKKLELNEQEKIEIAVTKANDEIFEWYFTEKNLCEWTNFKNKILIKFKTCNQQNKMFKVNNWVKIFDGRDNQDKQKFETGLINKVLENGFYEIVCKGKILKIHEISLEEL
ncbi:hypothetical protein GVAV_003072 [Gurleya vavrai]